jgi:hypothetical protein
MAYTTINKSSEYFDTKIYTGNGSSQTLDMDNLGLLWIKNRTETSNHNLFDVVRGGYYTSAPGPNLRPNDTTTGHGSDITSAYGITFGSSSSTIGSDGGGYNYNQNSKSYVGWQWRAGSSASSNTAGTINTTSTSVDTTAGFSISTYTGTGSNATVGHGLNSAPKMIIFKRLDSADDWTIYHTSLGATKKIDLNNTGASSTVSSVFNDTAPTNSLMYVGTNGRTNASGGKYVAYAFAEKTGYSKFGSYVGNGNADGSFIYCGFKPAFVLVKRYSGIEQWQMTDSVRDKNVSPNFARLNPDTTSAESTNTTWAKIEKFSNGFKLGGTDTVSNGSGSSYIFMAFGQSLVGSNNIPCTAR